MAIGKLKQDRALVAEKLRKLIPEMMDIQDGSLRAKVEQVWLSAADASVFDIEEAPNFPSRGYPAPGHSHPEMTRYRLVDHTRLVVLMANDIAGRVEEIYSIKMDLDKLLASAIIHDVDKMVFFTRKGEEVVISELGTRIPHGFFATKWALEASLPLDVVHAIVSHAGRASMFPKTLEGLVLLYADILAADVLRMVSGAKGILETYKHFGPASSTHP